MANINEDAEVILEIENTALKCKKEELVQHSDYFKVMFEGSFIERDKKVVKLEGISLKAMNLILALLWDKAFIVDEEDIPAVLQASCMLQFVEIKNLCIEKLIDVLCPGNCIKVWLVAEQLDIKPLYLKAKSMAFIEFNTIKDLDCIQDLQLKQLCYYLGNTNLQCKSELDVLQTCMKWWYENSNKLSEKVKSENCDSLNTDTLFSLLCCLDFKLLSDSDIQEITTYPDLSSNSKIVNILQCIIKLRQGVAAECDECVLTKAKMLNKSRSRNFKLYPCILLGSISDEHARKKQKLSSSEKDVPVVFYDNFKRKRYYTNIEASESSIAVAYYSSRKNELIKFLTIAKQKCGNLDGFRIVSYKELIFLFGGEFLIGKGNWNKNFWAYDTIREKWERKSVMPFVRRHFESGICGNYLYIIGGTGNFRVIQDNMFWYNYKEDKWSGQIMLPCAGRQIKCCCWNNQLVLLNINSKCGYLFDQEKCMWCGINISDDKELVQSFPDKYSAFVYKNSIYIKGNSITEMKIINQKLVVVGYNMLEPVNYDHIESVVCGGFVYTLYKQTSLDEETSTLTFEKYSFLTKVQEFILKDVYEGTLIELDGDEYVFRTSTTIFGFHHYELLANDTFVNDL